MSKNCEEQIEENLKDRIEDFESILQSEESNQRFQEIALGISETKLYRLDLSWGGPQDYFTFKYDPEAKELIEIQYHFLDWFDGAVRDIPTNSDMFKVLEQVFYSFIKIE